MKKIATLSFVAAAAIALTACGGETNNTVVENTVVLNAEEPLDNIGGTDLNATDSLVAENGTADLNTTTANVVE